MEEFELQLQWQSCNLMPLMARLSPGQLQEASQATRDTLASARQVPFFVEPPETIKRYWLCPTDLGSFASLS